jgi:hypothetical protein
VCLVLHGYGQDASGLIDADRYDRYLAAAVLASAPAIWRSFDESHRVNPGAFDSAAQWQAYDVLGQADRLAGVNLRIDCGESDPFAPAVRALQRRLPDPGAVHLAKGCHDGAFWQHVAPAQIALIGAALKPT